MAKTTIEKKNMTIEEMENFATENNLKIKDTENENIFYLYSGRSKKFEVEIQEEKKERKSLDRDIKIKSDKIDDIGVKLIYHRKKDGSKEYRIFIAQKKDGKLIRNRLRNDKIQAIQNDEAKMIEYFDNLIQKKDKKALKMA